MSTMIRITTGARLHFGLLDVVAPFGGCGVMIKSPQTIVEVSSSDRFRFSQAEAGQDHLTRVSKIARRISGAAKCSDDETSLPKVHVRIVRSATAHTGLGSGTQLSLAITEAILCELFKNENARVGNHDIWLSAANRGRRSAVGTHGYLGGGMIAEGFKRDDEIEDGKPSQSQRPLNSVNAHVSLPESWRVAIVLPARAPESTVAGDQEQAKFRQLPRVTVGQRECLRKLLTERLIPAAHEANFEPFVDAMSRYNRASGELFASVQGGPYNGPVVTRLVDRMTAMGCRGVGQSSWGPGVFAWFLTEQDASSFVARFADEPYRVLVTSVKNEGRVCESINRPAGGT